MSRRVAAGGALFLLSDLLIGVEATGVRLPGHGLWVMTTYLAALLLITTGWAGRPPADGPGAAPIRLSRGRRSGPAGPSWTGGR